MNRPIVICEKSFQMAWAQAVLALHSNHWDAWNTIVQIDDPELFNNNFNTLLEEFAKRKGLLSPKHVAHTIFPQTFYLRDIPQKRLYDKY